MAEVLEIRITAQDGASKTFQVIGREAEQVGKATEQAGKKGKQGMDELGRSAEQNAKRMERLKQEATAIGAVMGALGSAVITTGAAYRDQARQVDGITRLYGEQADAILQMTEDMQDFTRYSNDAARESALIASSLASNYDMSAEQISLLVERSADLAQVYGIDLPDAVMRTSAALRGEGESAELLGLNLSDAAVAARALDAGITNWNVPGALSEAEKAAFRFQLLMEDTQSTVGAAADAAAGAGGKFRQFINEIDDGVEAVGRFIGPVGEVAAEMAPIAMALPVVSAGIGRFATSVRGGSLAMAALGVATNPVALALGALAVAGVATWTSFREGVEATRALEDALIQLGDVSTNLRLGFRDDEADLLDEFIAESAAAIDEANRLADEAAKGMGPAIDYARAKAAELGISLEDAIAMYRVSSEEAERYALAQVAIGNAFANSAVDHAKLDAALDDLDAQWQARTITFDEYLAGYERIAGSISDYRSAEEQAVASTVAMNYAQAELYERLNGSADALENLDARYEAYHQRIRDFNAAALELTGLGDPLSQWNIAGSASDASLLAENLTDAAAAADNVFRVIVGGTDAIKDQANATLDWITDLVNVRGELGRIDELVNDGLISGTSGVFDDGSQYAEAQNAFDSIAVSVKAIEDNLDAVQAIQAPLMAEMTASTAAYTEELRQMPAEQQLVALAWMDTATSAQAMEIAMLGASAAAGDLGVNGPAAFADMAIAAAQTNPALAALLVDMQILEEHIDASGNRTYTVNTEGLEGAQSDIERLSESIIALIDLLEDGTLDGEYSFKVKADVSEADATVRNWAQDGYMGGWDVQVPVDADTTPAEASITNIPVTFWEVPTDADTGPAATTLNAFQPEPITVPIAFDVLGSMAGETVQGAAQAALGALGGGLDVGDVTITVSQTGAEETTAALSDVSAAAAAIPEAELLSVIILGAGEGVGSLNEVTTAAQAIPEAELLNVIVLGAGEATSALYGVRDAALSIPESVTTTVTTNHVQTGIPYIPGTTILPGGRHGGVLGYDTGGVVIRAAEAGPEMAYFAGGGMALLPSDGIYNVPEGTYISPNNALNGVNVGGINLGGIHVHGNVYGIDDLTETVMREMAPALEAATRQQARSMGGR